MKPAVSSEQPRPGSEEQPRGRDGANEGKTWALLTAPGLRTDRKHKLHPKLQGKEEKIKKKCIKGKVLDVSGGVRQDAHTAAASSRSGCVSAATQPPVFFFIHIAM